MDGAGKDDSVWENGGEVTREGREAVRDVGDPPKNTL